MDIGKVLATVARVLGEGAQRKYNVETLGPDFDTKIAQIKLAEEAAQRARELHGFEVRDQQAEETDRSRVEGIRSVLATGKESADPVVNYGAATQQDEQDRARAKDEAALGLVTAQTKAAEAKPGIDEERLEIQRKGIEARIAQAERAGDRAEAAARRADLSLILRQQSELRQQDAEARRLAEQEGRSRITTSERDRIGGLATSRLLNREAKKVVSDPEVQQLMGPGTGQVASILSNTFGGAGLTPKQQRAVVLLRTAFSSRAFEEGGKQLTGGEKIEFEMTEVFPSDTISQAMQKLAIREQILDRKLRQRGSLMGRFEADQARDFFKNEGIDLSDIFPAHDTVDTDGAPPAPKAATPPPGSPSSGKQYKFRGQLMPFEQLPPAVQAQVRQRGL